MNRKILTIVVPVYDAEKTILDLLDSCLSAINSGAEVIVVDDGSTDGSYQIVEDYAACHDGIRLYRQENAGPSAARNTGLKYCETEWVTFADADDELHLRDISFLAETHSSLLIAGFYFDKSDPNVAIQKGIKSSESMKLDFQQAVGLLLTEGSLCNPFGTRQYHFNLRSPWAHFYKYDLLKASGFFNESLLIGEDAEFNVRAFLSADCISMIDCSVYIYRRCCMSLTRGFKDDDFSNIGKVIECMKHDFALYQLNELCDIESLLSFYAQSEFFSRLDAALRGRVSKSLPSIMRRSLALNSLRCAFKTPCSRASLFTRMRCCFMVRNLAMPVIALSKLSIALKSFLKR